VKRVIIVAGSVVAIVIIAGLIFFWRVFSSMMAVETVRVDPQLTIMLGGGGNSIVLASEDGSKALVVDTKMNGAAKKLRQLVTATDITVVNTHFHPDHIGGNALYPAARIIAGAYGPEEWKKGAGKNRYPDQTVAIGQETTIAIGSETVHIRNLGRAHTTNDVVVYLENRKLLVTGDIVFLGRHPVLFRGSGCSVASWVAALDTAIARYDVKTLVPGHGPVSDKSALVTMRDYFVSIGDAINNAPKLAELKEKYQGLAAIPVMASFDKTVDFIKRERLRESIR
jgi:cyclase